MSYSEIDDLAAECVIKIAEYQLETSASEETIDVQNAVDEKIWNRAKKTVKKYWKKYDEPWKVVVDVYRKMGGKFKKKKKK
jgi:hypothetical protein